MLSSRWLGRITSLSSNPAVVGVRRTPAQALDLLSELVDDGRHSYLESLPALPEAGTFFRRLLGHQQVTDAYLLAMATMNDAVLLTLDRRIAPGEAGGAVEVITP